MDMDVEISHVSVEDIKKSNGRDAHPTASFLFVLDLDNATTVIVWFAFAPLRSLLLSSVIYNFIVSPIIASLSICLKSLKN